MRELEIRRIYNIRFIYIYIFFFQQIMRRNENALTEVLLFLHACGTSVWNALITNVFLWTRSNIIGASSSTGWYSERAFRTHWWRMSFCERTPNALGTRSSKILRSKYRSDAQRERVQGMSLVWTHSECSWNAFFSRSCDRNIPRTRSVNAFNWCRLFERALNSLGTRSSRNPAVEISLGRAAWTRSIYDVWLNAL